MAPPHGRRAAAKPVKKLAASRPMVVNPDFLGAFSKFQLSPFSAISQAVENARETGGRFNATTLRIDGPRRMTQQWGTGDIEWLLISDDGEGCYDILDSLNLGHSSSNDNNDEEEVGGGAANKVQLGNFGAGLKNVLNKLGDEAFIFSIPRDADNFMAVARYGADFQTALADAEEKKPTAGLYKLKAFGFHPGGYQRTLFSVREKNTFERPGAAKANPGHASDARDCLYEAVRRTPGVHFCAARWPLRATASSSRRSSSF
jgi:hypothetical protein